MKKNPENPITELGRLNAEAVAQQPKQDAATKELEAGLEARRKAIREAQDEEKVRRNRQYLTTKAKLTKQ